MIIANRSIHIIDYENNRIDNGDVITVRKNSSFPDKEYSTLVEDVDDETKIDVHIEINKNIESNTFSVYSFEKFTAVSKTGDYATMLLGDLKKNLIAIFGFLFTVSSPVITTWINDVVSFFHEMEKSGAH